MNDIRAMIADCVSRAKTAALQDISVAESFGTDGAGQEKVASPTDAGDEEYVKIAALLQDVANELDPDRQKEAKATHGVGGGQQIRASLPSVAGKQPLNMGRAKIQLSQSALVGTKGGTAATAMKAHTAKKLGDKKKHASLADALRSKLAGTGGSAGNGDDANITQTPIGAPAGVSLGMEGPGTRAPGASLLASNETARDFTPRDAAKLRLKDIAALLDQPAYSRENDPVLHDNLANAGRAGVKIASLAEVVGARKQAVR